MWFYLYMILDVFSRKIVGFEVHEKDDSHHAVALLKRTALAEGIHAQPAKPVLHGDNGSTLKATSVLAMMHWPCVKPWHSRPRVSDDNAYAESLFRTAKYRPEFRTGGFADLQAVRIWASQFLRWYNVEHHHSGIPYLSPSQRHSGQDRTILRQRHALYLSARDRNPRRRARGTRNWNYIHVVTLNPEREPVAHESRQTGDKPALAA